MPRAIPTRAVTLRAAIAVVVEDDGWSRLVPDPARLLRRAGRAALKVAPRRPKSATVSLSVALLSDRAMRRLNRDYRGQDKPTNVLSFPAGVTVGGRGRHVLGDVAVALGVVRREARAQGKTPADHLAHLMVHGMLHLLGYDHETERDAERMEALERKALAGLGIADPYDWR